MADGLKTLTKRQKAAIIVQYMIDEGSDIDFSGLPEALQLLLTRELVTLGTIDSVTLDEVLAEFTEIIEKTGVNGPYNIQEALDKLSGKISPSASEKLQNELRGPTPLWTDITKQSTDILTMMAQRESLEIAAVIVSKLGVERAAELLTALPGALSRKIAFTIPLTNKISPAVMTKIAEGLAKDYLTPIQKAFEMPPEKQLGAILTVAGASKREDILNGLTADAPEFAQNVRRNIFTFTDLPARLASPDVPVAMKAVDQKILVTALAHSEAISDGASEYILSNISKRLAEQIRDEMQELGSPSVSEGENAQAKVIAALQSCAAKGNITLFASIDSAA